MKHTIHAAFALLLAMCVLNEFAAFNYRWHVVDIVDENSNTFATARAGLGYVVCRPTTGINHEPIHACLSMDWTGEDSEVCRQASMAFLLMTQAIAILALIAMFVVYNESGGDGKMWGSGLALAMTVAGLAAMFSLLIWHTHCPRDWVARIAAQSGGIPRNSSWAWLWLAGVIACGLLGVGNFVLLVCLQVKRMGTMRQSARVAHHDDGDMNHVPL